MEILCATIGYVIGIIGGLYFNKNIVPFFLLLTILIGIFRKYVPKNIKRYCKLIQKRQIILFLLFFMIGNSYFLMLQNFYTKTYEKVPEKMELVAMVVSDVKETEYQKQYSIKIKSPKKYQNTYLLLKTKKAMPTLEYGEIVQITGSFEKASVQRNEGGFDYAQYLRTKKIHGLFNAEKVKIINNKTSGIESIDIAIHQLAKKIAQNLSYLMQKEQASLLSGILIGRTNELPEEIKEDFRASNLTHMLAVSGSHVSYVLILTSFLIGKLNMGKKKQKIITIALLLFFMLLTGSTASVQRACFMSIYMIVGSLLSKRTNPLISMSVTLMLLLVINPYYILDIGMLLSYGGAIGISLLGKNFSNSKHKIKEMIKTTVLANCIIIPIMAYYFNTLSLTFVISNLLAGFLIGAITLYGFLVAFLSFLFLPIAKIVAIPLNFLIYLFMKIAELSGKLPFSQITVPTPNLLEILFYYIILILFFNLKKKLPKRKWQRKITKRKIIIVAIVMVLLLQIPKIVPQDFTICFIDVGQGDSTLIQTPSKKTILIDGGGSEKEGSFDVGESILLPYLLKKKITTIDYMLISHLDADHCRADYLPY